MATNTQKIHEDLQKYVRSKRVDALVSSILEEIIKYRPNYVATFIIDYMFKHHHDDVAPSLQNPDLVALCNKLELKSYSSDYILQGYAVQANADIQRDLEKYLTNTNVQVILSTLVERMLIAEAANPFALIVENLCRDYPEQALKALEIVNPRKQTSKVIYTKNVASMMQRVDSFNSLEDEEMDGDDDDDVADLPSPKSSAGHSRNRRVSVSAESVDPSKVKEMIASVAITPKDPETQKTLFMLVNKSPMLKRILDVEERTLIVKAFAGPVRVSAGTEIIRQGDPGDLFYLLEKGTVDVFVRKPPAEPLKVQTYHEGDAFGQLALLYNAPRAATCVAVTDCELWTLDRLAFKAIVMGATLRKRDMYTDFLNKVPILSTLSVSERMNLADALTEERFEDNKVVCHEGDAGDNFYLVLEGSAECYQTQPGALGGSKLVGKLQPGQYFGEIALLTPKPRQATVRAKGVLKVLCIDRGTFNRIFGPLEEILKRNMEEYKKYV
eukprot:gene31780-38413_t